MFICRKGRVDRRPPAKSKKDRDTFTPDAAGRHATSTYGNAAVTTNSYRLDNLLASRATSHAGSEQIGTYSYSWDANKNKTAETIGAQGSGFGFSVPAGGYDQVSAFLTTG